MLFSGPDAGKIAIFLEKQTKSLLDTITSANFGLPAKLFFYETKVIGMMRWWFTIYHNINLQTVRDLQKKAWAAMAVWANGTSRMNKRVFTSKYGLSVPDLRNIYQSVRYDSTIRGLQATDPHTQGAMKEIATTGTLHNKTTIKGTRMIKVKIRGRPGRNSRYTPKPAFSRRTQKPPRAARRAGCTKKMQWTSMRHTRKSYSHYPPSRWSLQ